MAGTVPIEGGEEAVTEAALVGTLQVEGAGDADAEVVHIRMGEQLGQQLGLERRV